MYRRPSTGGDAVAIPAESGDFPVESADGDILYFAVEEPDGKKIHAAPVKAPANQSVPIGMPAIDDHSCWTVVRGGIYFVPAADPKSLQYFDFTTKRVRKVFATDKPFVNGVSVSPDGRFVLYTQQDALGTDLMLVDHFH